VEPGSRLTLLTGQPDPADRSHFTIPYRVNGKSTVIDGWVTDRGLLLKPRGGQLATGAAGRAWQLDASTAPSTAPAAPAENAAR
jgi:hypothetical protein